MTAVVEIDNVQLHIAYQYVAGMEVAMQPNLAWRACSRIARLNPDEYEFGNALIGLADVTRDEICLLYTSPSPRD